MNEVFGLNQTDLEIIISLLKRFHEVKEAILFGSRAKGNYRTGSDVDISLKGEELNSEIISRISYHLNEETAMPYKFDVVNYHKISNIELKNHIDRVGICFYTES